MWPSQGFRLADITNLLLVSVDYIMSTFCCMWKWECHVRVFVRQPPQEHLSCTSCRRLDHKGSVAPPSSFGDFTVSGFCSPGRSANVTHCQAFNSERPLNVFHIFVHLCASKNSHHWCHHVLQFEPFSRTTAFLHTLSVATF